MAWYGTFKEARREVSLASTITYRPSILTVLLILPTVLQPSNPCETSLARLVF